MTQKTINISGIRVNGGTQSRASINRDTVADYAEAMENGATFPPIVVFYDGSDYWLADGFHRYEAYDRAQIYDVPADVQQGTQRDAILYSVGANASHGLQRTNEDKQRAVKVLLNDPEWSKWSDREIARQCQVGHQMVGRLRAASSPVTGRATSEERTYTTKHGTQATMQTGNIGAEKRQPPAAAPSPVSYAPQSEPTPEPEDPADAKLRKEFRALTNDAREDAYVGLSLDLKEAQAANKKQAAEIKTLKEQVKGFEGDQAETIRRLSGALRHKESEMFRANDKADKALARAKHLERRVKELESVGIAV